MDEELVEILGNADLDDAGKAEAIKGLVGKSFVPTSKFKDEKTKQTTAYNALKAEYDQFKADKMTDEEKKAEHDRQIQEQYKKTNLTLSRLYAENTFSKAGFKEDEYKGILDTIVEEDAEKTKGLAQLICNTMLNQRKTIEKEVTDKFVKGTQTPPAGNANDAAEPSKLEEYQKALKEAQNKNDYTKVALYTRLVQTERNKNEE